MKKIFNYIFVALASVLAIGVSSCTNDYDYDPATIEGIQVYFSNTLPTTVEVSKDKSSFDVTVSRVNTADEITVPVNFDSEVGSVYSLVNKTVTFKAGESTANVAISYNPASVIYGKYSSITLQIGDETYTTPYGNATYSFKAGATEWEDMQGSASYREDCMTTFFNVENVIYNVKIQKNIIKDGVYRLVNPYGKAYPYNEPGDYDDTKDYYMEIDASDPNHVYVVGGEMGFDWNYGMISISSLVDMYLSGGNSLDVVESNVPEIFGKLENGVITMPAKSMTIAMANYNGGGLSYSGLNGLFAVALPGYSISDYSLAFAKSGVFIDNKENEFVTGTLTLGEDVASVKYSYTDDASGIDALYNGIVDGSVEATTSTGGAIQLLMDKTGTYYLVVVGYNADGEVVSHITEKIDFNSTKDAVEKWNALYTGIYTYTVADYAEGEPGGIYSGSYEGTLYQSESNSSRFKIEPWAGENSKGLIFTWNQTTNVVKVDNCSTGDSYEGNEIFATDFLTYDNIGAPTAYVPSSKTFNFYLAYHISNAAFAFTMDTFTITGEAGAKSMSKAASTKKVEKNTNLKYILRASKRIKSYSYIYNMK